MTPSPPNWETTISGIILDRKNEPTASRMGRTRVSPEPERPPPMTISWGSIAALVTAIVKAIRSANVRIASMAACSPAAAADSRRLGSFQPCSPSSVPAARFHCARCRSPISPAE